jgi:hypothetical protein
MGQSTSKGNEAKWKMICPKDIQKVFCHRAIVFDTSLSDFKLPVNTYLYILDSIQIAYFNIHIRSF